MKNVLTLLDAIHLPLCRPEYQPNAGMTHCNSFVNDICQSLGYKEFDGMLANDMVMLMEKSGFWTPVPMEKCQEMANAGSLIVAALEGIPHGHVCVVCPGKPKTSGRWGQVPSCANVGKEVFIGKGVNWAFGDMPKFYAWRPTL